MPAQACAGIRVAASGKLLSEAPARAVYALRRRRYQRNDLDVARVQDAVRLLQDGLLRPGLSH